MPVSSATAIGQSSRLRLAMLGQPTVRKRQSHPCGNGGRSLPINCSRCATCNSSPQSEYSSQLAAADGRQSERWRMVQAIDNIGICTTDLTRSVTFYERLGLTEAYRNDRGVMMAAGTVQLFLFQVRRPDPAPVGRELGLFGNPPGIDHISFAVTDVDALYAK